MIANYVAKSKSLWIHMQQSQHGQSDYYRTVLYAILCLALTNLDWSLCLVYTQLFRKVNRLQSTTALIRGRVCI